MQYIFSNVILACIQIIYAVVLTTDHLPDRIWKADESVSLWSGLTAKLNNTQTILKDQGLRVLRSFKGI